MMHDQEKSDLSILAVKSANKAGQPSAESMEQTEGVEGNARKNCTGRTPSRETVSLGLDRVRQVAKAKKKEKFTALLHHVDVELLRTAFSWLKRDAAPGEDGVTWREYEQNLEENLIGLHARVHRGAYRVLPSRRKYRAKPDGKQGGYSRFGNYCTLVLVSIRKSLSYIISKNQRWPQFVGQGGGGNKVDSRL